MIEIKNTDHLFKDSPDPGEQDCTCSRCHRRIHEGETVARNAINSADLVAVDKRTGKKESLADKPKLQDESWEFRLCKECNIKWLRRETGQSVGLCTRAVEKCPDSFWNQIEFIRRHGKKF